MPPARLLEAAELARRSNVPAASALIDAGFVDEETFYRALARHVMLPYLPRVEAGTSARYPESVSAGIVPLASSHGAARFALAPRGDQLGPLLARAPHGAAPHAAAPAGMALTSPRALREAVMRVHAGSIADHAANDLPDAAPAFSYRDRSNRNQRLAGLGTAVVLLAAASQAPAATLVAIATALCFLYLALVTFRIAACLERHAVRAPAPSPRWPAENLPVYTIIVPLYREARVVPDLCRALLALDYPLPKLDIKLVVEADDAETADALRALDLPAAFQMVVAPPGRPRTKPRALNVALPLARGEFLVVYDAEDAPDPGQLRLAVATFAASAPDVVCLQGRLAIRQAHEAVLTRMFAIEYAALFDVVNPGLASLGLPVPLGGTSNHLRVEVLRSLRGWDAWNVTEDADLGMRLAFFGYRTADLPSSTSEEAPAVLGIWIRQRARWMKGYMQVAVTHGRHPLRAARRLGPARFLAAAAMIAGTVAAALFYPPFLVLSLATLVRAQLPHEDDFVGTVGAALGLVTFTAGWVSMLAPALIGLLRRRWYALLPWVALLPAYYLLVSLASWRALYEFLVAPDHWHKTEHGLGRAHAPPQKWRIRSLAASSGARVVSRVVTKRLFRSMT